MRWVGQDGLRLGDGTFVPHGAEVPAGALSPEQIQAFEESNPPCLVQDDAQAEPVAVLEEEIPVVRFWHQE